MAEHGLLEITAPELAALTLRRWGSVDALRLAFERTDRCPARLELRLGALTRELDPARARAAELADALLARLRYSNAERKTVARLNRAESLPLDREPSGPALRRWLRNVGPDLYLELCTLLRADLAARAAFAAPADADTCNAALAGLERLEASATRELEKKPALALSELALDGKRLMKELELRPGPELGKLLTALLELVLDDPELNTVEQLLARARALRPRA